MSEISQFSHAILRSVVAQIFKAIGWKTSSNVCIQVLVDVLHRYLKDLCFKLRDCADSTGRQTPSMQEVAMLVKMMNIDLEDLAEYMHFVDPIVLGYTVPKYPIPKEPSLDILKPGSAEVVIRPPHIHEHLPPMYPHLEESEESASSGELLPNDPLTTAAQSEADKEREIVQKCKEYNISREEGRRERILSSIAMTTSGFLTSRREGRVADSRLPPELVRDESPEIGHEQRKRRKSCDKKSTDRQKHSKKKEESKKQRVESHSEGVITGVEHNSLHVGHEKSQLLEKCTPGGEKGHGSSHKHKHKHKRDKTLKLKINSCSNGDVEGHNGMGKNDHSVESVTKYAHQIAGEHDVKDKKHLKRTHDLVDDLESESPSPISSKVSKRGRKKRKLSSDNIIYPDKTEDMAKKTSVAPTSLLKYPSIRTGPGLIPTIAQDSFERFSSSFVSNGKGTFSGYIETVAPMEVCIENEVVDVEYEEKEDGILLEEVNAEKEKKKSKKEHKKKKDKKDKNKKKDKKDKNKDKSEKKKEKCKKHKKSHDIKEDVDQQVAVPKFKLNLGNKSFQEEVPSMLTTPDRMPTVDLPKVNIRLTKIKSADLETSIQKPISPITIEQAVFMTPKPSTSTPILQPPVQKRGRGRPRKNEIVPKVPKPVTPKVPKRRTPFYYDGGGNQVWVCPFCGIQDDGSPMIGCDGCDAWYHWACIDMTAAPVSKKWFCPFCAKS